MALMKKKGTSGAASNYISRTQAVRKLQISLADFRRLCILKGIYPRAPKSIKKAGGGSTTPKTFYYAKDIQYLMHEPVLQKFREQKAFLRKLKKAMGKKQDAKVKSLEAHLKPEITLDHIVKERYPTFVSALRDLDDCLSLLYLFASLAPVQHVEGNKIQECQKLVAEWENYIIESKSLRKVFLSIKGIYYQVEVRGEKITWLVPWKFTMEPPSDVDFRILATFLTFYLTLQTFVNYKLYSSLSLAYPPKLESTDATTSMMDMENTDGVLNALNTEVKETSKMSRKERKAFAKRLAKLDTSKLTAEADNAASSDASREAKEDNEEATLEETADNSSDSTAVFKNCVFYLSREVPLESLSFVIKACGGQIGWDASLGPNSPFTISDWRITHHIIDRPFLSSDAKPYEGKREFVQPQWVYDCINAEKLLKINGLGQVEVDGQTKEMGYGLGRVLPAHLSPFVVYGEGVYKPKEALVDGEGEQAEASDAEEEVEEKSELEDAEQDGDDVDEEEADEQSEEEEEKEAEDAAEKKDPKLELQLMMLSKKDRRLWNQIQYGKKRKNEDVSRLVEKRKKLEKSKTASR